MLEKYRSKLDSIVIDEIELMRFDVDVVRHYSWGNWYSRQIGFIRIASGSVSGWGENRITSNDKNVDVKKWGECFAELKGMPLSAALSLVAEKLSPWGNLRVEMAEMALIDLAGKKLGVSAAELLDMPGEKPVPGLYCVLEDDAAKAGAAAAAVKAMGYSSHIKVKLFGKPELDKAVITAVRKEMGRDTYIVGDVNCGYRMKKSTDPVDDIAPSLMALHAVGLNACEDPADMDHEQWVALQKKVGALDLIPDHIMRPAVKAIHTVIPGMGRIYNIHPGCMGSVIAAVALAKKVRSFGAKLMIGDDSLIGPALSSWQQVAVGLDAEWVEALEKEGESEVFLDCVRSQATEKQGGTMAIKASRPGFGLDIDTVALRKKALVSTIV
ncbi:MAG: enolase C-terminal domain-like protein [Spirochaetota bacterium]